MNIDYKLQDDGSFKISFVPTCDTDRIFTTKVWPTFSKSKAVVDVILGSGYDYPYRSLSITLIKYDQRKNRRND